MIQRAKNGGEFRFSIWTDNIEQKNKNAFFLLEYRAGLLSLRALDTSSGELLFRIPAPPPRTRHAFTARFNTDEKTNVKLTGILGRKGLLDKTYYQNLSLDNLEQELGYKIFMFHTTITELKPKHLEQLDSQPATFLPKGFRYYAGGHIHHPAHVDVPEYGPLTYPGALFPNNFAELEKYGKGGYYLISVNNDKQEIQWLPLEIIKHLSIIIDCTHKSPEVIAFEVTNKVNNRDLTNTVITIRIHGQLSHGKVSDIPFQQIFEQLYQQGAYFIMKNTCQISSPEYEEIMTSHQNPEVIEESIIREHLQQQKYFSAETELHLTKSLLTSLHTTKKEGETTTDFQKRIESEVDKLFNL